MRFARRAAFVIFILAPAVLFAQAAYTGEKYPDGSPKCSFDKSVTLTFEQSKENPTGAITGVNDRCVSETVSISNAGKMTFTAASSTRARVETACSKRDNCSPPKCGNLTIKMLSGSIVVNKCDPDAKKKIEAALAGGAAGVRSFALQSITSGAVDRLDFSNEADRNQTQQILTSFGVSDTDAADLMSNKPQETKDLLKALASGNEEQIQNAADSAGVELNKDLSDIVNMSPEDRTKEFKGILTQNENATVDRIASSSTFPTAGTDRSPTELPVQCGISTLAGNIMRAESSCGRINHNPLSSVQGPYHFLCGTWQAYVRQTGVGNPDCAYRNDPQMSTQVMDAMMERHWQTYGSACTSAGVSKSSCLYGIHVFGESGFKGILGAQMSNPNASALSLCGSAISTAACTNNMSIFRNGGTVAGVFGELDRRLGGNGTVIASVATGGSPIGLSAQSGIYGYGGYGGSPFAQVNPARTLYTTTAPVGQPSGIGSPIGGYSAPIQQTSIPGTVTNAQPTQPVQPPPAVATLITQPKNPLKGDPVTVSWATVGMRTDTPCIVYESGTFFAQGNEGTRVFPTKSVTAGKTLEFRLKCTSLAGPAIERAATSTVK